MDPITEYLTSGGSITRCPTVYLLPVTGAAPIRSGVSDRVDENSLPLKQRKRKSKEEWMARARAAKKANGPSERELNALAIHREHLRTQALAEAAKLREMWERGETLETIAHVRGCSVPTVKKLLRKAGASVKVAVQPPTMAELRQTVIDLHSQGLSCAEIGKKVRKDAHKVRLALRAAGLTPHRSDPKSIRRAGMITPETVDEIVRLYATGLGSLRISKLLGVSKAGVLTNLRRLGIQPRAPKGAAA
jgi:DNA invertase Pin-like site-specific DNA recombinase